MNEYTEWERPIQHPVSIRDETLEALSDAQYVGPVTQTVDLHASAKRNNSYFYVFEYQSKYSYYQQVKINCILLLHNLRIHSFIRKFLTSRMIAIGMTNGID